MANRFVVERGLILDRALEALDCVLGAKNAQQRIKCAAKLLVLADALGIDKKRPPSYTLVDAYMPVFQILSVEVPRAKSLEEALQMKYSDHFEIDITIKAFIVASSVVAIAATMPAEQRIMVTY